MKYRITKDNIHLDKIFEILKNNDIRYDLIPYSNRTFILKLKDADSELIVAFLFKIVKGFVNSEWDYMILWPL